MEHNPQHMMAVANTFWPFSYPLKSYELALHPAFLQTAYRGLPTLSYGRQFDPTQTQTSSPSTWQKSTDKFSIDAILNRDKDKKVPNLETTVLNEQNNFADYVKYAKNDDVIKRRHDRLLDAANPYLGHQSSLQEKHFLQKHLQSTYKHFTDNIRSQGKLNISFLFRNCVLTVHQTKIFKIIFNALADEKSNVAYILIFVCERVTSIFSFSHIVFTHTHTDGFSFRVVEIRDCEVRYEVKKFLTQ